MSSGCPPHRKYGLLLKIHSAQSLRTDNCSCTLSFKSLKGMIFLSQNSFNGQRLWQMNSKPQVNPLHLLSLMRLSIAILVQNFIVSSLLLISELSQFPSMNYTDNWWLMRFYSREYRSHRLIWYSRPLTPSSTIHPLTRLSNHVPIALEILADAITLSNGLALLVKSVVSEATQQSFAGNGILPDSNISTTTIALELFFPRQIMSLLRKPSCLPHLSRTSPRLKHSHGSLTRLRIIILHLMCINSLLLKITMEITIFM
jgi:hypothetical protein